DVADRHHLIHAGVLEEAERDLERGVLGVDVAHDADLRARRAQCGPSRSNRIVARRSAGASTKYAGPSALRHAASSAMLPAPFGACAAIWALGSRSTRSSISTGSSGARDAPHAVSRACTRPVRSRSRSR